MAMTNIQQNAVSTIQDVCGRLVSIRSQLTWLAEVYGNEGLANLTADDFAAIPSFAHITPAEFQAAMAALATINTALNAGTPAAWTKLLKLPEAMPK